MARKKYPPVDIIKDRRSQRLLNALSIRQKWPHVKKVTLQFTYQDTHTPSHSPKPETIE